MESPPLYQIVASTLSEPIVVDKAVMLVGSDETCDLVLQREWVEPTHLRLAPLPGKGVLLVNLATAGRTRIEGAAMERKSSIIWEVNQVVAIGDVLLRLLLLPPAPLTVRAIKPAPILRDTDATSIDDGLPAPAVVPPAEEVTPDEQALTLNPSPERRVRLGEGLPDEASSTGSEEGNDASQEPAGLPPAEDKSAIQDSSGSPSPSGTPRSGEGFRVRATGVGVDEPFPHLPRLPDDDDEPPTIVGDDDDVGAQYIAPLQNDATNPEMPVDDDDATPDKPLPAVAAPMPPPVGAQPIAPPQIAPVPSPAPLASDTPDVPFLLAPPEPPTIVGDDDDAGAQSMAPLPSPVPVPAPASQPRAERHTDAHDERTRRTEVYLGAMPDEIAYVRPRETRGYETLVKDWHYAGTLGLQMTMREVRLAQGERVRVPFSISNDGVEPLQVQVYVTGLPEAWIGLSSAAFALTPGEVRLIDLVLQPHEGAPAQALPAAIYAHDVNAPHAKVSSTFQVTIKPQRDVVGWLQPATVRTPGTTELVLQNHTQATARIFLSSGSADDRLRVTFDMHELQLPAGETVRVPVRLHVARRPLWRGWQAGWYASVKAGSRAAIVYEAVARVRPRIGWAWLVIVLLALLAAALIAVYQAGITLTLIP